MDVILRSKKMKTSKVGHVCMLLIYIITSLRSQIKVFILTVFFPVITVGCTLLVIVCNCYFLLTNEIFLI